MFKAEIVRLVKGMYMWWVGVNEEDVEDRVKWKCKTRVAIIK